MRLGLASVSHWPPLRASQLTAAGGHTTSASSRARARAHAPPRSGRAQEPRRGRLGQWGAGEQLPRPRGPVERARQHAAGPRAGRGAARDEYLSSRRLYRAHQRLPPAPRELADRGGRWSCPSRAPRSRRPRAHVRGAEPLARRRRGERLRAGGTAGAPVFIIELKTRSPGAPTSVDENSQSASERGVIVPAAATTSAPARQVRGLRIDAVRRRAARPRRAAAVARSNTSQAPPHRRRHRAARAPRGRAERRQSSTRALSPGARRPGAAARSARAPRGWRRSSPPGRPRCLLWVAAAAGSSRAGQDRLAETV